MVFQGRAEGKELALPCLSRTNPDTDPPLPILCLRNYYLISLYSSPPPGLLNFDLPLSLSKPLNVEQRAPPKIQLISLKQLPEHCLTLYFAYLPCLASSLTSGPFLSCLLVAIKEKAFLPEL